MHLKSIQTQQSHWFGHEKFIQTFKQPETYFVLHGGKITTTKNNI